MGLKKQLFRNTIFNGLASIYLALIQFVSIPILIQSLGKEVFGVVAMINVFSILGYISILDLGIPATIQRFAGNYLLRQQFDDLNRLLSAAVTKLLIVSLLSGLSLVILRGIIVYDFFKLDFELGSIVMKLLIFQALLNLFSFGNLFFKNALESLSCFKYVSFVTILIESFKIACIIYASRSELLTLSFVVYLYGILSIVTFFFYLFKFFNKIPGFSYNPTALRFSRDEVRYSNSSLIGKFSSVVYNQSDKLLVTYYLGPSSMATYEVLSKIPSLFSKVIGLSAYAIVPSISSSDINTVTASKIFNLGLEYMIKLIVPVLVFFIIYSDALLEWWVGDEFLSVSNLLVLMLFWSFLTIFTFGGNILLGLNVRLKEINGFRIIQATIKVVALFLMIGYFGLYAVPISFILSMSALLYLWRIFHKEFQISYKKLLRLTMSILMISSTIYLTYYLSFELSSIFRITLGLSHLAILLTMLWHKKIILIINDLKS